MREQWQPVVGGTPTLHAWPEGQREKQLTAVEKALLEATIANAARKRPELTIQANLAECTCREFTGYGAYLNLVVPDWAPPTRYHASHSSERGRRRTVIIPISASSIWPSSKPVIN